MRSEIETFVPGDRPAIGAELRLIANVLLDRGRLIAKVACLTVLLTIGYLWVAEPQYEATSEILIDPRAKQLVEHEVAPTGLGVSSLGPDTLLLDSQIEVIRSNSVLDKVLDSLRMLDPDPNGEKLLSRVIETAGRAARWVTRGPRAASLPDETLHDATLRRLRSDLRVDRKNNTYVVAITVRRPDRFQAAKIANAISETYVSESNRAANAVVAEAADSLSTRLKRLQEEAVAAEHKVEDYRVANGLTGTPDVLVIDQQLKDLNSLLSSARATTKEEEARWQEVKSAVAGDVRQLTSLASFSALQSPLLTQLMVRFSTAVSHETELTSTLLPRHPQVQTAIQQRQSIERLVRTELRETVTRLEVTYKVALRKEHDIEAQVKDLENRSTRLRMASIGLNELMHDAQIKQTVLQSFVARAQQAQEQVGLPASTSRIITQATPASRSVSPPVPILLGASVVLGTMLGLMLAWLLYLLNGLQGSRGARRSATAINVSKIATARLVPSGGAAAATAAPVSERSVGCS